LRGLFFLERKYGPAITPDEVSHLLRGFGKLDFIRPANAFELAQLNLNEGVMVQFQMYDDGQAALQVSRSFPGLLSIGVNFTGISQR
jgi:hypothetical protein